MTNKPNEAATVTSTAVIEGRKQIRVEPSGTIAIDGPHGVNLYRLLMIKSGMELETRTKMRLTRKAPSCFTIAKREHNLRGNKLKVYRAFCERHAFEMPADVLEKLGAAK